MKPKGIMFKTFMFTTALILLVGLISFGILYAVLPEYYSYRKNRALTRNADALVAKLGAADFHVAKPLLADFCINNNVILTSFDSNGHIIPELSYPLIMLDDNADLGYSVAITMQPNGETDITRRQIITGNFSVGAARATDERQTFFFRQVMPTARIAFTRGVNSSVIESIDISGTLQPIDEAQGVVLSLIPYLLGLDIIISLIAAYLYSKRLTRPIIRLSDTASHMRQLTPGISSGLSTNDELGLLSRNLDSLYIGFCGALQNLNEEMAKVSELERSKTDFMRAASHELKTPIAALNCITEGMLDEVGVYADRTRYLHESKRLIDKLTSLVEEILNASKSEHLSGEVTEVELSALLDATLEDYAYELAERDLRVDFKREAVPYHTDELLMRSALSNIISNAVRYSDSGGLITLGADENVIFIENQCAGIPEDALKRVFEPFYVLDYSRDRSKSGTGIGLFIVKKNLDALGLDYELMNTGTGVRFNIYL